MSHLKNIQEYFKKERFMSVHTGRKILKASLFCLFISMVTVVPHAVTAAGLVISPTRITLTDEKKVQEVRLTNASDGVVNYVLKSQDYIMNPDGTTAAVETFEYSARRMMRFVPNKITLQPGEKQIVRVVRRIRNNTEPGEYHTHLAITSIAPSGQTGTNSDSGSASFDIGIKSTSAIPVIVSVGKIETTLGMTRLQITPDDREGYTFNAELTRSGNGQGVAFGYLDLILNDNSFVPIFDHPIPAHIYREIDAVAFTRSFALPKSYEHLATKIRLSLFKSRSREDEPISVLMAPLP